MAAELKRLADKSIRTVIIPGTHDVYDRASIYRAYDLTALAGVTPESEYVVVLTPDQPEIDFPSLDAIVYGRVFATKRAPSSPLAGFKAASGRRTWRIGLIHGSLHVAGKSEHDDVVFTADEIAASGLDYLALGHWHSAQQGRAGATTYAYAGAPEPVALDQDRAGNVLLVTLDKLAPGSTGQGPKPAGPQTGGVTSVSVEERAVGRTRFEKLDVDAATIGSQPALVELLRSRADPDLVLDVRVTGVKSDDLDVDPGEVEAELAPALLRVRVRDVSVPALTSGPIPPADTILGSFIRDTEAKVAELEKAGRTAEAAELRDVLRLGRLLLAGQEVTL